MKEIIREGKLPKYKAICPLCRTLFSFDITDVDLDGVMYCPKCNRPFLLPRNWRRDFPTIKA